MPRTATHAPEVAPVLEAVGAMAASAFQVTEQITARTTSLLEDVPEPRRALLSELDDLVVALVEQPDEPVQGAGFVAAVGLLADAPWWLEWFLLGDDQRARRLVSQSDPEGVGFYDYEHFPWYVVPRDTGRRHVTGPYVDYLCTDDYTLTFTVAVRLGGRFAGVAGADIGVETAERLLLPSLRASGRRLAVVNAQGRIVSSNSGRHLCGDLVEELDVPAAWAARTRPAGLHVVDDLPLAVLELDRIG